MHKRTKQQIDALHWQPDHIKTASMDWTEIQSDVYEKKCVGNRKGINISILKIEPNKIIAAHTHKDTRYNYILKGSMSDGTHQYGKGDIAINRKGSRHLLQAGPRGCEFLLIW